LRTHGSERRCPCVTSSSVTDELSLAISLLYIWVSVEIEWHRRTFCQ
jgi:hypothetical protein